MHHTALMWVMRVLHRHNISVRPDKYHLRQRQVTLAFPVVGITVCGSISHFQRTFPKKKLNSELSHLPAILSILRAENPRPRARGIAFSGTRPRAGHK